MNLVLLRGRLSRDPTERTLPSGDELTVLELTVAAGAPGTRAESVPLSWFDAPGWVMHLTAGAELVIRGRVRRRFFQTAQGLQSRTEVVVEQGAPSSQASRAAAIRQRAADAVLRSEG